MVGLALEKFGRVLVVDDEDGICSLMADILEAEGFEVSCAASDREAYAVIRRDSPALRALVIDINLGRGTTGFDVAREARSRAPRLPVVFISGGADSGSIERFGVPGAVFVRKPFTPEQLSSAVRQAMEGMA